jgi:formiminoglutamase
MKTEYRQAQKGWWEGRKSNPDMKNQYWHQEIKFADINDSDALSDIDIAILGYVCDEGVRRNRGRIGANDGPQSIRERLAKLPIHFDDRTVADVGDILCPDDEMEDAQEDLSDVIEGILKHDVFPIALGGGHDMSYGHFKGIWKALNADSDKKIGVINFDAHFDLRPVEKRANSGTPFNQILREYNSDKNSVEYFAIGIQQQSNTRELFDIAKEAPVEYAINYECESSSPEIDILKERLRAFISRNDYIYVTIDMDGFSSAYAPGVSAPSPLGFTPYFVFKLLHFIFKTKKVVAFDIAELNPSLDRDKLTANLAAKIVDFVVMNR